MANKKKAATKLDQSSYAADYGFQLAFLKSDPSLYQVFQQAVANNWDNRTFQMKLVQTKWWKTYGEAYRQGTALEKVDPATFNARMQTKFAQIADISASMGSTLSGKTVSLAARNATLFGWDDSQVRNFLSQYIVIKNGRAGGAAGDMVQELQRTAWRNGVKISDGWLQSYARRIAAGNSTLADAQRQLRQYYGASLAPGFSKELAGGQDLYDVAQPYMQAMAQTLELNPSDVTLFDPVIRQALAVKDKTGKTTTMTLPDFEQQLRNDSRYMKTKGAQDAVMAVGRNVLQNFGMLS